MNIRTRIFLGIFIIVGIGFYFLVGQLSEDLKLQYRESTEEPLVDAARILAALAAASAEQGQINVEEFRQAFHDVYRREFSARIYNLEKTNVDFRVYITDANGIVIFDSRSGMDEGEDYSGWRDVRLTLAGEYGARTSRDLPDNPNSSVLHVAAPIMLGEQIIGVLTVGKPTINANHFIELARRELVIGASVTGLAIIVVGLLMSAMVTRPIERLMGYAQSVRDGERVQLPTLGSSEIGSLGNAFEEMRDALEGKQYVEQYVQTLTHELKSPLAAIQGAAELLEEEMPPERRELFLTNIRGETGRIRAIVEKMLLLSALELRKGLENPESIQLADVITEIQSSYRPLIEAKKLTVQFRDSSERQSIFGEYFLVRQAVANIFQNAIEFSPVGGEIQITTRAIGNSVELEVRDQGPGIPPYAVDRVFERFYSLPHPDSGRKSSGLGLSFVREVALLHGGSAILQNGATGGALAYLVLPRSKNQIV